MAAATTNKRVTEAAVAWLRHGATADGDSVLNEAGSSFANLDRGRADDE